MSASVRRTRLTSVKLINLTPHDIDLYPPSGAVLTLPSKGNARVEQRTVLVGTVGVIPLVQVEYGELTGLPAPEPGVLYIVSALVRVAAIATGRTDTCSPGDLLRDAQGKVIGCRNFIVH